MDLAFLIKISRLESKNKKPQLQTEREEITRNIKWWKLKVDAIFYSGLGNGARTEAHILPKKIISNRYLSTSLSLPSKKE